MIGTETLIVGAVVIVMLFGAQKLPELAKAIGRSSGEFQKGKTESEQAVRNVDSDLSQDREKIPITVLRHKKTKLNKLTNLLLYGYGSYGCLL